jgi:hypothetical protein
MQSDAAPHVVVHTLVPLLSGIQIPPEQFELSVHPFAVVAPPLPLEPLAPPREIVTVDIVELPPAPRSPPLPPTDPALLPFPPADTTLPPRVPASFRHAPANIADPSTRLESNLESQVG